MEHPKDALRRLLMLKGNCYFITDKLESIKDAPCVTAKGGYSFVIFNNSAPEGSRILIYKSAFQRLKGLIEEEDIESGCHII